MAECDNCGTFVTSDFARVFGDNDGNVYGCLDCMLISDIPAGVNQSDPPEPTTTSTTG